MVGCRVVFPSIYFTHLTITFVTSTSFPRIKSGPEGYKTFYVLNSTEHEISTAHKNKILKSEEVSCLKSLRCGIYYAHKC